MAKVYIDAAIEDARDGLSTADGSVLTLTNDVRLLYDDTLSTSDLFVLIDKIKERIQELES